MHEDKLRLSLCVLYLYLIENFVLQLRAVRPAVGNRSARNWQLHSPQLKNEVFPKAL